MSQAPTHINEDERFRRLQELLFVDDGELTEHIRVEVETLRQELRSPEEIMERVEPFIENKMEFMRENFPELFGPMIASTIKKQIEDSQDEMIDALYPIIGKLIRKFLSKELERLVEQVDRSMEDAFSWKGWKRRVRGWFSGQTEQERFMRDLVRAEMEQVFIIDKESGLLGGSWSRHEVADEDLVAGMLTAIKSFVETAFSTGAQDLETIEYDTYKIILHNFHTYYVAVILSGPVTSQFKQILSDFIMALEERFEIQTRTDITGELFEHNSEALKTHFHDFIVEDQ